eukprot:CAMPEP_0197651064 /NCGR_PEP_ID=MMETSP1338-20131121/31328_1 /TAXON_ID=43686 ORGANISM="Pelagodinium beii, Strain RCC1491" /NCGR_SAMPLE_ID=MMETSP1338 /ASSEMBLY_ACC=CAM_ASM_000754 /LENGTH=306 /DNA_ID=CAMNT_0043225615 /DNA_START=68 /DNA_END=988 /DNA_ORIENTATION=-
MDVSTSRRQRRGRSTLAVLLAVGALTVSHGMIGFVVGGAPRASSSPARAAVAAPETAPASNPAVADMKARLLDLLEDDSLQGEVLKPEGKPIRGRLDETIVKLERLNANEEPVYSTELDGSWLVKYAGTYAPGLLSSPTRELALFLYGGGFSLGNALSSFSSGFWGESLGVKLGSKKVEIIGGRDVEATAVIEIAGRKETLTYKAELMPLSAARMSEEVVSVKLPDPIGQQDLPLELRRSILVTYLDEDMMIVRDESGVPEVLMRELVPVTPQAVEVATNSSSSNATSVADDQDRALLDAAESEAS